MSDAGWFQLVSDFLERRTDERTFHDRFFDLWHASRRANADIPRAIEALFYVVEAYCPDPGLRDPASLYEADDTELREAAEKALAALPVPRRFRTFLNRMKP